jgi:hypothetical protein
MLPTVSVFAALEWATREQLADQWSIATYVAGLVIMLCRVPFMGLISNWASSPSG